MLWDSLLIYAEELMFLSKLELLLSGPVRGQSFAKATKVLRKKKLFVHLCFRLVECFRLKKTSGFLGFMERINPTIL